MSADLRNLTLLRETELAIQVRIPKSMIECRRNFPADKAVDITIPEWLADKSGFVY